MNVLWWEILPNCKKIFFQTWDILNYHHESLEDLNFSCSWLNKYQVKLVRSKTLLLVFTTPRRWRTFSKWSWPTPPSLYIVSCPGRAKAAVLQFVLDRLRTKVDSQSYLLYLKTRFLSLTECYPLLRTCVVDHRPGRWQVDTEGEVECVEFLSKSYAASSYPLGQVGHGEDGDSGCCIYLVLHLHMPPLNVDWQLWQGETWPHTKGEFSPPTHDQRRIFRKWKLCGERNTEMRCLWKWNWWSY